MLLWRQKKIEEVFVIETETIRLFGALVKEEGGKSTASGSVLFQDGDLVSFSYPPGYPDLVRKKLLSICEGIALHYDTQVYSRKFDPAIAYDKLISLLVTAKHKMN